MNWTKEEILEYNKRCAEFLGWYYENNKWLKLEPLNGGVIAVLKCNSNIDLKFHSDWNWIMEVVDAIEKLGYESLIGGSEYYYPEKGMRYIQSFIKDDMTIYQESKTKKEAVVQAINQFLIWYNNEQRT